MPQRKASHIGPPLPEWFMKMVRDYDEGRSRRGAKGNPDRRKGIRPDGPLPLEGNRPALPLVVLTDDRLPAHAARVYCALVYFVPPRPPLSTRPAYAERMIAPQCTVHDRDLEVLTGLGPNEVRYARKKLEQFGYVRNHGQLNGKGFANTYELVASNSELLAFYQMVKEAAKGTGN